MDSLTLKPAPARSSRNPFRRVPSALLGLVVGMGVLVGSSGAFGQVATGTLAIPSQRVLPGQTEVWFPVEITSSEPVQGFQLRAVYDPSFLELVGNSLEYTETASLEPEFYQVNDRQTFIEVGCIFDFFPPFAAKVLSPGADVRALHLIFNIAEKAAPGTQTRIALEDDLSSSPILNVLSVAGRSVRPSLADATVRIGGGVQESEALFTRGDSDGNGVVNLADVLGTVNYLFRDGVTPRCLDAADFDDSGRINLLSVLSLLRFMFRDGPPPAVPFPSAGLDPTADLLNCR